MEGAISCNKKPPLYFLFLKKLLNFGKSAFSGATTPLMQHIYGTLEPEAQVKAHVLSK